MLKSYYYAAFVQGDFPNLIVLPIFKHIQQYVNLLQLSIVLLYPAGKLQ